MKRKLTDEQVIQARQMYMEGRTCIEISRHFGFGILAISHALRGKTRNHLPGVIPRLSDTRGKNCNKARGSQCRTTVLSESSVSHIKAHLKVGVPVILLAKYFKSPYNRIRQIACGLTWKHVKPHANPPPLILSPERELPIRLRGRRLEKKLDDKMSSLGFVPDSDLRFDPDGKIMPLLIEAIKPFKPKFEERREKAE